MPARLAAANEEGHALALQLRRAVMEKHPPPRLVTAEDRHQRREELRAPRARRDALERQAGALQQEMEHKYEGAGGAERRPRKLTELFVEVTAVEQQLLAARVELSRVAAAGNPFWARPALAAQPERAAPLRTGGERVETARPPLRVTIMSEPELARSGRSGGLRGSLVLLLQNGAAAAATDALAQGSSSVGLDELAAGTVHPRVELAQSLVLGCFGNISACVRHVGEWWAAPSSIELLQQPDRHTDVVLLCPASRPRGDVAKIVSTEAPSAEQIIAGLLMYQMMQELDTIDIDLGDEDLADPAAAAEPLCQFAAGADGLCRNCSRAKEHEFHTAAELGDGWTTRAVLSHVIEAVSDGDDAWQALWAEAYEQQRSESGSAEDLFAIAEDEDILDALQVDSWPGILPVYVFVLTLTILS